MSNYIYVDIESTGLDARKDKLRVVSINGQAFDWWEHDQAAVARRTLEWASEQGNIFVAHNAQFDLDFLYQNIPTLEPWKGQVFDTMVAYQLLTAGRRIPARLDVLVKNILGMELDKTFQKTRWDGAVDDQMLEYASKDTQVLERLVPELVAGLRKADLHGIFNLEMALLPVLLAARRKGIRLDREGAQELIFKLEREARELEEKLPVIEI